MKSGRSDMELVTEIANRAVNLYATYGLEISAAQVRLTVGQVHYQIMSLRLNDLLNADIGNFAHDIGGMMRHWNAIENRLDDCFSPRYAE